MVKATTGPTQLTPREFEVAFDSRKRQAQYFEAVNYQELSVSQDYWL